MRIPESELIINSDGSAFHIHIKPEELADNIILVGDPGRIDFFEEKLNDIRYRHFSREFRSVNGEYKGKRFTVLSTGIGTDNIDIVMTEIDALANIDFNTRELKSRHRSLNILRIGTSGALQPDIPLGSYVFSQISAGFDGLMNWYADRDKVADTNIEKAFVEHTGWLSSLPSPCFVHDSGKLLQKFKNDAIMGITASAPGFYGPQGREVRIRLAMADMLDRIGSFSYDGLKITNFEMEGSAIAGLARHLGHEAGTICCIIANRYLKTSNTDYHPQMERLVDLVLEKLAD